MAPTATAPPGLESLAAVRAGQEDGVLAPGLLPILTAADAVFLTVFGDEGESGATQRYLDAHGLRYTGPSAAVCTLTFDKEATKEALVPHGIVTPAWHRPCRPRACRAGRARHPGTLDRQAGRRRLDHRAVARHRPRRAASRGGDGQRRRRGCADRGVRPGP
jgi:hypothetical protein